MHPAIMAKYQKRRVVRARLLSRQVAVAADPALPQIPWDKAAPRGRASNMATHPKWLKCKASTHNTGLASGGGLVDTTPAHRAAGMGSTVLVLQGKIITAATTAVEDGAATMATEKMENGHGVFARVLSTPHGRLAAARMKRRLIERLKRHLPLHFWDASLVLRDWLCPAWGLRSQKKKCMQATASAEMGVATWTGGAFASIVF
jgi:hypothetical protein